MPRYCNNLLHKLCKINPNQVHQKLQLADLGLNINDFSKLRLSYNNLPIDQFYPSQTGTVREKLITRCRRFSSFQVKLIPNGLYQIQQNPDTVFSQDVTDFRKIPREFESIEPYVIDQQFLGLITNMVGLVNYFNPTTSRYNVAVHQVRLLSYPDTDSDNSPEGIHQDGADYIVSALVLNKHNITQGQSIIYDEALGEIFRTELQTGEFIFQGDRNLWHDITPIKTVDNYIGYRDILGFDLKITS